MSEHFSAAEFGLQVVDIGEHSDFVNRPLRERDLIAQRQEMQRLVNLFVAEPTKILQRLADAAMDLCGADSAGISVEQPEKGDAEYWFWAATSGRYRHFANSAISRYPSACATALERGSPQHLIVTKQFFDLMGLDAPLVTDGLLLPWSAGERCGTIWILAHERTQAFDLNDLLIAGTLADFAAMAMRQNELQKDGASTDPLTNLWARSIKDPLEISMRQMFLEAKGKADLKRQVH